MARARPREAGMASVGVLLAAGLAVAVVLPQNVSDGPPFAVAREGHLVDTIVETGTLSAARLMLHTAPLGGQWKIVELVPEGTLVASGDLLVRFDDGALRQTLAKEEATKRQLEAELRRTQEELRLERMRAEGELAAGSKQVQFAERDLANEKDGKGRFDVAQAEAVLAEAGRELQRTRTAYEDVKPLLAEGFLTRAELERAEQAWRRAEEQARLARLKLDALVNYERPDRHHPRTAGSGRVYEVVVPRELLRAQWTFNGVLLGIGALALLISGMGIMNIMVASVSERMGEIGIRRACGARRRDILVQFSTEAALLCGVGGVAGTLVGALLAYVVAAVAGWPVAVSAGSVAVALSLASAVGLLSGTYPARLAARMDPAEASSRS
ncbi:MAG: FtsX-like permease family protein [Acidobacteria bacterium]|nr:FtsX-like permease family protein [Acidobacteriota bacterium]